MRAAVSELFRRRGFDGNAAEDIRRESDALRTGTHSRIAEMKREISLLISEYDDRAEEEQETVVRPNEAKVTGEEFEPLSNSVRIIKLKNS